VVTAGRLISHAMAGFCAFHEQTVDYAYYKVTPRASRLLIYEFYEDAIPIILKELKFDTLDFGGEVLTCPDGDEFYLKDPNNPPPPEISPLYDSVSFFDTNYPIMLTDVQGNRRFILTIAKCKIQYISDFSGPGLVLEEYAGLISLSVDDLVADDPSIVVMDTVKVSGLHPPAFSPDFGYCHTVNVAPARAKIVPVLEA